MKNKKTLFWLIPLAFEIIIDRISKYLVDSKIQLYDSIKIIDGFFYISHIKNSGAAWGILQNGRLLFIIMTILAGALILVFFFLAKNNFLRLSLVLLFGGACGNLIDRIFAGNVTDFLEFQFGNYIFPLFNAADVFVVSGTIGLALYILFFQNEKEKNKTT